MMDTLGVVERTTTTMHSVGRRVETTRARFLDWTLNGIVLRSMLGWETPPSDSTCLVSGWDLDEGLAWLERLRFEGAGGFPDGRAAVLVCPECGDLECGALSVNVTRGGTVVWSDFGWQVPRKDGFDPLGVTLRFEFATELLTSSDATANFVVPRSS